MRQILSPRYPNTVWAIFWVSATSCREIRHFLLDQWGIKASAVVRGLHLTAYHARCKLHGVSNTRERVDIQIDTAETRFMVMTPGGESPRDDVHPNDRKCGIRLKPQNSAMSAILAVREQFYGLETEEVVGERRRSSPRRNAFGAHAFQPHITLVLPGSGVARDLKPLGAAFRQAIPHIHLDSLTIEHRSTSS
jgi:hypothetical protein